MALPYTMGSMAMNPILMQLLMNGQGATQPPQVPPMGPIIPQVQRQIAGGQGAPPIMGPGPQPPQAQGAQQGQGGIPPGLLQMLMMKNMNGGFNSGVPNTPSNNYYYGLTGGQGNPNIYGNGGGGLLSGLLGGGSLAGMGAPT